MKQVPDSLLAFQHMFPDDDACAALMEMRWPDGFVCPACGHEKGWALRRKAHTFECAGCRPTSDGRDDLHASKLPLTVWFWAAYLMATHSTAVQLQKHSVSALTAALGCSPTLRASMVDPERNSLSGLVEIRGLRTKDDPPTGGKDAPRGDAHRRRHRTHPRACGWRNLLLRRRRPRTPKPPPRDDERSRHNVHVVGKTATRRMGAQIDVRLSDSSSASPPMLLIPLYSAFDSISPLESCITF